MDPQDILLFIVKNILLGIKESLILYLSIFFKDKQTENIFFKGLAEL